MNLILCHSCDKDAIWLYLELKKLDAEVFMLAAEQVFMAAEWTQVLTSDSDDYVLDVNGFPAFRSGDISFLLNRTQLVEPPLWKLASEKDRNYVRSELTALLTSWLWQVKQQALVLNPFVGYNLCGVSWSNEQWTSAAYEAGFKNVASAREQQYGKPPAMCLVIEDTCLGLPIDYETEKRCFRLAKLAQSPLLEIYLQGDEQNFSWATPFPALRKYGYELVSTIHNLMTECEK